MIVGDAPQRRATWIPALRLSLAAGFGMVWLVAVAVGSEATFFGAGAVVFLVGAAVAFRRTDRSGDEFAVRTAFGTRRSVLPGAEVVLRRSGGPVRGVSLHVDVASDSGRVTVASFAPISVATTMGHARAVANALDLAFDDLGWLGWLGGQGEPHSG